MYQVKGNINLSQVDIEGSNAYVKDRTKWQRPQLMVWSHNEGVFGNSGSTQGNTYPWGIEGQDFIITSDHNRSALSVDQLRIENRMRMVGGNMRSYYTGQKVTLNCSWNLLPSRAYQRSVMVGEKTTPYSQWPYGQPREEIGQKEFSTPPVTVTITNLTRDQVFFRITTSEDAIQNVKITRTADATDLFVCGDMGGSSCNLVSGGVEYTYDRQKTILGSYSETQVSFNFNVGVGNLFGSTAHDVSVFVDFDDADKAYLNTMPTSEFTADGGAGGADLLTWYRETHGPFWVFLSYDNWPNFSDETADGEQNTELWDQWKMYKYSDRYMMYFTSFNYSVEKRGLYDMWNVSVSLEEA